jgi:hypothetical protein
MVFNGKYVQFPLYRFAGETVFRNPYNGAVYGSAAEANGATGDYAVTEFADAADYQSKLAAAGGDILTLFYDPPDAQVDPPPPTGDGAPVEFTAPGIIIEDPYTLPATNGNGAGATTTTTPTGLTTLPIVGPIISQIGDAAVGLPVIGPFITRAADYTGWHPGTIVVIGGIAAYLIWSEVLSGGSGGRRK